MLGEIYIIFRKMCEFVSKMFLKMWENISKTFLKMCKYVLETFLKMWWNVNELGKIYGKIEKKNNK